MPALDEVAAGKRNLMAILSQQYGNRLEDGYLQGLVRTLGGQDAEKVIKAVEAHIFDDEVPQGRTEPVGHFPPSVAQIMARVNGRYTSEQVVRPAESKVLSRQGRKVVLQLSEAAQQYTGIKKTLETWASDCSDCSDTGMARYYQDPRKPKRVFTASEALELPDEMLYRLRCCQAICDCRQGDGHPGREWQTRMWWRGVERDVPVFVRLEKIRTAAAHRRATEVGV